VNESPNDPPSEPSEASAPAEGEPVGGEFSQTMHHVRKVRDGEQDSWQTLSDKILAFLGRQFGRRRLPLGNQTEDLQQAVILKLLKEMPRFEIRSRLEFWGFVQTLAIHTIRDWERAAYSQKRDERRTVGGQRHEDDDRPDLLDQVPHVDPTPSQIVGAREIGLIEEQCLQRVPNPEYREVYRLRRVESLDYADIVTRLGKPRSSVTIRWMFMKTRQQVLACVRKRLDSAYGDLLESLVE
jgi:RNA polymerase sigma factor (sigma-70 family)